MTAALEGAQWRCRTTLRRFEGDVDEYVRQHGREEGLRRFYAEQAAKEEQVVEGNLLLRAGIVALWNLVTGAEETAYSTANARLGVGTSSTGAVDTNTDLTNGAWKGMETGYPLVGAAADKKVTFRAIFGAGDANQAWNEWGVDNGAAAHVLLNRKVESLGTKSSGSWQLTVEISLA